MGRVRVVQLLECDPGLADGLTAEEEALASKSLPLQAATLEKGPWRPSLEPPEPGHLGFLVVQGVLIRRLEIGQGSSVELLGQGELLRPWQEDVSSFCASSWEVVERTTVVQLGPALTGGLCQWPPLIANIAARAVRRSRALAADAAISNIVGLQERLLILLWQLSETWGEARKDGVHVSIRLPHRLLAELAGARRPSITSALAGLQEEGRLASSSNGSWVLHGDPPY